AYNEGPLSVCACSVTVPSEATSTPGKSAASDDWVWDRGGRAMNALPTVWPLDDSSVATMPMVVLPPLTKPTFDRKAASERSPGMSLSDPNACTAAIDWPNVPPPLTVVYVRLAMTGPPLPFQLSSSAPLPLETPNCDNTSARTTVCAGGTATGRVCAFRLSDPAGRYRSVTPIVVPVALKRRRSLRQKVPLAPAARPAAGITARDPDGIADACK